MPHPSHAEEVKAVVVRAPGAELTEDGLIAWCKQNMAAYKYPRLVEFRDSLPMTATGKILKRELAQEQAEPAPPSQDSGCAPGGPGVAQARAADAMPACGRGRPPEQRSDWPHAVAAHQIRFVLTGRRIGGRP